MTMSHDPRTATADRSDLYDSYETDHDDGTNCPEHGDCDQCIEDEALDAEVVSAQRTLERLALARRLRPGGAVMARRARRLIAPSASKPAVPHG